MEREVERFEKLPIGGRLWLKAHGRSLWPFIREGDSLLAVRCPERELRPGHVAVRVGAGVLVAHVVVGVDPLETASAAGIVDEAFGPGLGRVVKVKQGQRTHGPWWLHHSVWRWVPYLGLMASRSRSLRLLVGRLTRWSR